MAQIMNVEDAVDGDFAQCNIDRQINAKVQPNAGGLVVVLMELSAEKTAAAFRVVESVHRQIF